MPHSTTRHGNRRRSAESSQASRQKKTTPSPARSIVMGHHSRGRTPAMSSRRPTARAKSPNNPGRRAGRQYHIGLAPGEVAPVILLVGDPARARRIAARLERPGPEACHREFVSITGRRRGRPLTVMATGIGCDNTEIAVVELCRIVERPTFLRVGTCGALRPGVDVGNLCLSTGALRLESTSLAYVDPGYPALAHH
ncbi:MAG: hypothetical protein FJ296_03630, partial [Planctomycetes bacterium]|nr:hypothetical protein [Planctomycetota bacterium]